MARNQSNPLVTLGKRILGFSPSGGGCCAGSAASAAQASDVADTGAPLESGDKSTPAGSCCATAETRERADRSA